MSAARYIAIEGPLRVGKSSLARALADRLRARTLLDGEDNPHLEEFYKGASGAAFRSQMHFLMARYRQLVEAGLESSRTPVVADYLFQKYPFKDEGFLTDIRSRLVNRESLNNLGRKVGIDQLINFDANRKGKFSHKSLYGDALEALIGAVYLDRGYRKAQKFVLDKLIFPYFNIEEVIKSNPNYKSRLIEWAQKR